MDVTADELSTLNGEEREIFHLLPKESIIGMCVHKLSVLINC